VRRDTLLWEFRALLRPPVLEIVAVLFFYVAFSFLFWLGMGSATMGASSDMSVKAPMVMSKLLTVAASLRISEAYFPFMIFAALFCALTFANEIEKGTMKGYLSLPVSRAGLFLSKFLAVWAPLTLASSLALIVSLITMASTCLEYGSFIRVALAIFATYAILGFFLVSIGSLFSIVSKNTYVGIITSFFAFYVMGMLNDSGVDYLPDGVIMSQYLYLAGRTPDVAFPSLLVTPVLGVIFFILGFIYFTRRLEVG